MLDLPLFPVVRNASSGRWRSLPARSLTLPAHLPQLLRPHRHLHRVQEVHLSQDLVLHRIRARSMENNEITDGCYCGEVRFATAPAVRISTNCHCANCRRAAGAQAVAWIVVKRSRFQFVKGTPRRYRTDTGAWRTFCGQCGTSLTYETDRRPDEIDITTGSLDHPEDFPPTKDVYPEERLPWVDLIHA